MTSRLPRPLPYNSIVANLVTVRVGAVIGCTLHTALCRSHCALVHVPPQRGSAAGYLPSQAVSFSLHAYELRMRLSEAEIITLSPLSCSYLARIQFTKARSRRSAFKRPLKCHGLDVGKLSERRPPGGAARLINYLYFLRTSRSRAERCTRSGFAVRLCTVHAL